MLVALAVIAEEAELVGERGGGGLARGRGASHLFLALVTLSVTTHPFLDGAYSICCLPLSLIIDHASLSGRSAVPAPYGDTSSIWTLS